MKPQSFRNLLFITVLTLLWTTPALAQAGDAPGPKTEEDYYKLGLDLFREGYYDLLPQGKVEEGMKKLDQAAEAFQSALALDDRRVESHWHLARIFNIQLKHEKAADQYRRVIDLDPGNPDNYLMLASTYVQMKRFSEARSVLEQAKPLTRDTVVIERIDALVKSIQDQEMTPKEK